MAHWESYLSETDYVAGDVFSIADCEFYPVIAYLEHRGWGFDGFAALRRYADRVRRRKCAIDARPEGWEGRGKDLWGMAVRL